MIHLVRTEAEVKECVDMYMGMNDFVPMDFKTCFDNLRRYVISGRFVRCIKRDGVIIAWIYCDRLKPSHSATAHFHQMYFCCNQTGTAAARCVRDLHEAMVEYAKQHGYTMCMSIGSHADENFVFARLLARMGWRRQGSAALLNVEPERGRHAPPEGHPVGAYWPENPRKLG